MSKEILWVVVWLHRYCFRLTGWLCPWLLFTGRKHSIEYYTDKMHRRGQCKEEIQITLILFGRKKNCRTATLIIQKRKKTKTTTLCSTSLGSTTLCSITKSKATRDNIPLNADTFENPISILAYLGAISKWLTYELEMTKALKIPLNINAAVKPFWKTHFWNRKPFGYDERCKWLPLCHNMANIVKRLLLIQDHHKRIFSYWQIKIINKFLVQVV